MALSALLLPLQRLIADIELIFDHRLPSAAPLTSRSPHSSLSSLSSLSAVGSSSSAVSPSRAPSRDNSDDKSSRSNRRAAIALVLVIAIAGVTVSLILACSTSGSLSPRRLRFSEHEPPYGSTAADWNRVQSPSDGAASSRSAFSGDEGDDGPGTPSASRGWWGLTRSAQAKASAAAAAASAEVRLLLSLFRVTALGQRLAEAVTLECTDAVVRAPEPQASLASPSATAAAAAAAAAPGSLGSASALPGSSAGFGAGADSSARIGADGGDFAEDGSLPGAHPASGASSSARSASAERTVACSARERAAGAPLAAVKAHRVSAEDEVLLALVRGKKVEREQISLGVTDPAIAFLFLAPPNAALPSPAVWNRFFEGHEGKYNVYVHAHSGEHSQTLFFNDSLVRAHHYREGDITAVDALRRLLAPALANPRNFRFLILSPSCVPVRNFTTVWRYLMASPLAYLHSSDPEPSPSAYSPHMAPDVRPLQFTAGSQWMAITRRHAYAIVEDRAVYAKFAAFCRNDRWHHHCNPAHHYVPTLLRVTWPDRVANRSVIYAHSPSSHLLAPPTLTPSRISSLLLHNVQEANHYYTTSQASHTSVRRCIVDARPAKCFLFLSGLTPAAVDRFNSLPLPLLGY